MALMPHEHELAGRIALHSWQLPHSWLAWPSIVCDLKSLLSHAGDWPDSAPCALLHRKHL